MANLISVASPSPAAVQGAGREKTESHLFGKKGPPDAIQMTELSNWCKAESSESALAHKLAEEPEKTAGILKTLCNLVTGLATKFNTAVLMPMMLRLQDLMSGDGEPGFVATYSNAVYTFVTGETQEPDLPPKSETQRINEALINMGLCT